MQGYEIALPVEERPGGGGSLFPKAWPLLGLAERRDGETNTGGHIWCSLCLRQSVKVPREKGRVTTHFSVIYHCDIAWY